MQHKQGENREQMFMLSLESSIAPGAFVRVVRGWRYEFYSYRALLDWVAWAYSIFWLLVFNALKIATIRIFSKNRSY